MYGGAIYANLDSNFRDTEVVPGQMVFPYPYKQKALQRSPCSINVFGKVCVNVCGVSTMRLRHVSEDADLNFLSIF